MAATRTTSAGRAAAPAGRRGRELAPKGREGRWGFMDDDDPDFEEVVRNYAALSGEDPDELMREEAARRASGGTSRSLDEVLADERAKASEAPAAAPSPPPSPAPRVPSTSSTSSTGGNGAGVLLGMLGYAVLVNFLHGGPAQVRGWMAAKFLNKPYQGGPK